MPVEPTSPTEPLPRVGAEPATGGFSLPAPPILPAAWDPMAADAVAQLVALNGNHWRKIVTLMAKICSPDEDWRTYRDRQLLKHKEVILIGAQALSPLARWHLVTGRAAADRLGLNEADAMGIAGAPALRLLKLKETSDKPSADEAVEEKILLTPYLDYRQYPNLLVEATRRCLGAGA
jgi:hypothetical protein